MALGKKTGGRTKGTRNKRTAETVAKAAEAGELPHEFLLRVSRGERIGTHIPTFEQRCQAAKDAAPYYAPKLQATTLSGDPDNPLPIVPVLNVTIGGTGSASPPKAG